MDNTSEKTSSTELAKWVGGDFARMRSARKDLEDKWNRNFDAYNNVDDATKRKWKEGEGDGWRSRSYIGVTRQKIMAAYALLTDMTLRGGRIPMMLKRERALEEPEPEPVVAGMRPGVDGEPAQPASMPDRDAGAGGMERLINSQMDVCGCDKVYKQVVLSMAVFGEGWSKKGAVDVESKRYAATTDGWMMLSETKRMPSVSYLPVWDVFRDLETDDLEACSGICHRQLTSAHELRSWREKERAGYIPEAIDDVLSDLDRCVGGGDGETASVPAGMGIKEVFGGSEFNARTSTSGLTPSLRDIKNRRRNIEVVERWGRVPRKSLEGMSGVDVVDSDSEEVECVVTVVADKVIRFALTKPSDRPFCRSVFESALDSVGGVGIADKIEHEQRVLNGAVRAFEDNTRLAGDVMLAVKRRFLLDQDKMSMRPGGVIDLAEECQDARQAVQQVTVQNVGNSYQAVIALIERYAEESSMIPRITQGASPIYNKTTTLGEINQQTDKAGKYMSTVILNIDDGTIEPWGSYFLDWNMEDPTVPDELKGSYYVVPLGFTSYEDKVLKFEHVNKFLAIASVMPQLLSLVRMDSLAGLVAELLDLDHDELIKSSEQLRSEQEAMDAQRAQDESAMAMVEKTRAQAEKIRTDAQAKALKVDQDNARIGHEAERLKIERARLVGELQEKADARERPSDARK